MNGNIENNSNKKKIITKYMILYELRNVTGNPFVHIFGVGMPIFMAILITRITISEISDSSVMTTVATSIFLGIGAMIPMATILMGYAVRQAQDYEKGIPERLQLFGIRNYVTICNRVISELLFMAAAFVLYFSGGYSLYEPESSCDLRICPVYRLYVVFQHHVFHAWSCDRGSGKTVQPHILYRDDGIFCVHDLWRNDGDFL